VLPASRYFVGQPLSIDRLTPEAHDKDRMAVGIGSEPDKWLCSKSFPIWMQPSWCKNARVFSTRSSIFLAASSAHTIEERMAP